MDPDKPRRRRMLVVLGEGGHTTELLRLVELLGDRYEYHCLISKEDNLTAERVPTGSRVFRVARPRGKDTGGLVAGLRTFWVGLASLWVLARVRPAAILSTGPAIAVPVSVLGKTFGVQILFVETGSRIRTVSMTGRIMYRWADVFFVQWPQLQEQLPKAIYAGRLV